MTCTMCIYRMSKRKKEIFTTESVNSHWVIYGTVFRSSFLAVAERLSEIWHPVAVSCQGADSMWGWCWREYSPTIGDPKWCVPGYFKEPETNFLDRLKVASCQKNFASCQAILPVAKFGNWQPKKRHWSSDKKSGHVGSLQIGWHSS